MNGKYQKKFGFRFVACFTCGLRYDTEIGDLGSEDEVFTLAEDLHKASKPKCKNRKLLVEITDLRYEVK